MAGTIFNPLIATTGALSSRTDLDLLCRGFTLGILAKVRSYTMGSASPAIPHNDMRALQGSGLSLFSRIPSTHRLTRQQCYAEQIKENGSNWKWYHHLAEEMVKNTVSFIKIEGTTFTTQDLLLRAIAINPNEFCSWSLLTQNWPSSQSSLRVAIEGSEEFCFTKQDAEHMTRELDTSKYTHAD